MSEFDINFRYLSNGDRQRLFAESRTLTFGEDDVIVTEGTALDGIYIVRTGEVRVERNIMNSAIEIARLAEGEMFGEMSFVDDIGGASSSVVADGPVTVDCVPTRSIKALIESEPGFAGRFFHSLASVLSKRLRATTHRFVGTQSWG